MLYSREVFDRWVGDACLLSTEVGGEGGGWVGEDYASSIWYTQAVTRPSTNRTLRGLTSLIGPVLSDSHKAESHIGDALEIFTFY